MAKKSDPIAASQGELDNSVDVSAYANLLVCHVIGRWQQFGKSGFTREPMAQWAQQWAILSHINFQ